MRTIIFNGTKAKWDSIIKKYKWYDNIPATVVNCTDGDVSILKY